MATGPREGTEIWTKGLEVSREKVAFECLFRYPMSTSTRCLVDIQVWKPEDGSELRWIDYCCCRAGMAGSEALSRSKDVGKHKT